MIHFTTWHFAVFKGFADSAKDLGVDLTLHKLVYIACQLGVLLFITHRWVNCREFSRCAWLTMVQLAVSGLVLWAFSRPLLRTGLLWFQSRLLHISLLAE